MSADREEHERVLAQWEALARAHAHIAWTARAHAATLRSIDPATDALSDAQQEQWNRTWEAHERAHVVLDQVERDWPDPRRLGWALSFAARLASMLPGRRR